MYTSVKKPFFELFVTLVYTFFAGRKKDCSRHALQSLDFSYCEVNPLLFSTAVMSLAVAGTIRMPLSLIPSSSASSCRRPVDFSALLFGKKN